MTFSADAGVLQSGKLLKAKFKISDKVLEELCFPARTRLQCKDINQAALDYAYGIASNVARNRS